MSDPVFGAQDPAKVGVAQELNSHQVEYLSFMPVGGRPDRADGGQFGGDALLFFLPSRQADFEHEGAFGFHARKVVDDLQMRIPFCLGRLLCVRFEIVNRRDAIQHAQRPVRIVAYEAADLLETLGSDFNPGVEGIQLAFGNQFAKSLLQLNEKFFDGRSRHRSLDST